MLSGTGEDANSAATEPFSDIAEAGVHRANVEILAARGIFEGTECAVGRFCPDVPIPRWVMAVWMVRALDGADPAPMDRSRFADVDEGAWWSIHVERLGDLGITRGCEVEPPRFCPDSPVTRAQMATFLTRAFRLPSVPDAGFTDVGQSATHLPDINSLAAAGITSGCAVDPARYCPGRATTRAQMATFLTRALRFAGAIPSGDAGTLIPPDEGDFTAVAVGWDHSCGIRRDRTVSCWGDNARGQAAPPDGEFVALAAGRSHTCGIDARQEIVCWGWDGRGATEAPEGRFIAVTAGGDHSCAIRADRERHLLGRRQRTARPSPPPGEFAAVAAGEWHTCGLRNADRSLTCWGADNDGQADPPPGRFVAIAAGNWHSCGVRTDGVGVCWGADHAAHRPMYPCQAFPRHSGRLAALLRDHRRQVRWSAGASTSTVRARPSARRSSAPSTSGDRHSCGLAHGWGHNLLGPVSRRSGRYPRLPR